MLKTATKLLKLEYEGLLFAPIFYEESISFLTEYKKKDTPIVMIDSNLSEINDVAYIGQDSYQSGYLGGKLISYGIKNESNVLILIIVFVRSCQFELLAIYFQWSLLLLILY